ncbi:MAG: hypothetical protein Tsb009_32280 [Planctomycetaceae bacterium]
MTCAGKLMSGLLLLGIGFWAISPDDSLSAQHGKSTKQSSSEKGKSRQKQNRNKEAVNRVSVEVARERAKLLHEIYADMLQVLHRNYFREKTDRTVVPSKSLEDVFHSMKYRSKIEARWIAVNANAMHLDHKPKDTFEKEAARALASGKKSFERVEQGVFRRAGPIPLFNDCLKCHAIIRSRNPRPRLAGLIINIPVKKN